MAKATTAWGSSDSGKSIFYCIFAKAFTRDKSKTILINMDISVPTLPVWFPEQLVPTNISIGQASSSVEINTALTVGHVTVLKSYPFIGLIGYCAGENPLSYPEMKYDMAMALIAAVSRPVDFVTLDCNSTMTNVSMPAAIESGDLVTRILASDLEGTHYPKAHQPLLADSCFRYHGHLTFAGLARPSHAIKEMGHLIGGFDSLLPYGEKMNRYITEGDMFHVISYCNPKYMAPLNKALEMLRPKEEGRQRDDFVEERQKGHVDEQSE